MGNEVEILVRVKDMASAGLDKIGAKGETTAAKFGPLGKAAAIGIGAIGAAAAVAVVEGVKMGSAFQSSMEQLHTQAHVPQKAVDDLSQRVLNLAGSVGEGPDSLSEALYHIESSFASTGITGGKAMNLLKTSAEGAKMGHADLVDVTNALDAAVVSGIPGVSNFDQAMGMLNATVGAGDMKMQDLADAFGTGAVAVVKNYGLSLRDVGSALAVFGDNNIRGAAAGTALRMTVQSLAVPAKTGKKALEELGLSQDTLAKDMQSGGLLKAVGDLHDRLEKAGLSGKKSGDVLTQAFGKKAGVGLTMLVDQFDRLKSKYKEIDKGANTFKDSWDAQQKTFKQGWDDFTAGVQAALIKLGLKLLPMLSKLLPGATKIAQGAIDDLTSALSGAADVLTPLFHFIGDHSTIFGSLATSVGVLVGAWKLWVGAIKVWEGVTKVAIAIQAAFDAVMDANPIGLVIIAIAALAAGLIYAYTHSAKFRAIVDATASALTAAAKATWNFGVTIAQAVAKAVAFVIDRFGDMATFVGNVLSHIPGMGAAGQALKTLGSQAHNAAQKVRDVAAAMEGIKSKSATLTVRYQQLGTPPAPISSVFPWMAHGTRRSRGTQVAMAHGGIVGHAAEGGPRSAQTLVGEYGPELVDLAPGSTVHSNPDTERMLGGYGGNAAPLVIHLQIGDTSLGELLIDPLRKSVRTRGGNVQAVLGR